MKTGRTIAIGDVHGCSAALATLVEAIALAPEDRLVLLGDYIDRGPDSRGVLDQCITLSTCCQLVPLMGNHELMLLEALESLDHLRFWLQCGGSATLESYGGDLEEIPDEHLLFIRSCRHYFETERYLFFHANFDPRLAPDQQPHRLLFWEHLALYADGSHTLPGPHLSGKTAFVGHTPQENGRILDLGHVVCIDTYCVGGGRLTAIDVESRQLWQADRRGRLLRPH